ncbi:uncharacterized protein UDID_17612 [Ustilago sp. UG-2017a]|nr:uncharacterized protein UDID_17612 [Ustilago sp. UG-2017a]
MSVHLQLRLIGTALVQQLNQVGPRTELDFLMSVILWEETVKLEHALNNRQSLASSIIVGIRIEIQVPYDVEQRQQPHFFSL